MSGFKTSFFIVLTLVFLASGDIASKDSSNSVTDALSEVEEMGLPPGLNELVSLPELNEGEEMWRERCLKNGHNESFNLAMEARENFTRCLQGLIDVKQLRKEVEAAKPTGDLDIVFKKYCRKTPIVRGCIEELMNGTESCLAENERSQLTVLQNVSNSLMNFICYKEGDRIALFIAEGGPDCLQNKAEAVQNCVNSTLMNSKMAQMKNFSSEEFEFDAERCGYFTQTQKCVVKVLEECSEPTPANIVGSLFDFVRKATPCSLHAAKATDGSSSLVFSVMSIILPIGAIILSRV